MEKDELKRIVKAINRELDALSAKSSEALAHAFYYFTAMINKVDGEELIDCSDELIDEI